MFRSLSVFHNKSMAQMVKQHLGPVSTGTSSYPEPSTLDPRESARNYKIAANMRTKSFMGMKVRRVVLPHDTKNSQPAREREWFRQSAQPWNNQIMPSDPNRLNNPGQASFVKQPRKTSEPGNYGKFYALMHAVAAAFSNLQGNQQ